MDDKKIINAFNDLTKALDEIAAYTRNKASRSNVVNIIQNTNVGKKIEEIKEGIKNIKRSTNIIKNLQRKTIQIFII